MLLNTLSFPACDRGFSLIIEPMVFSRWPLSCLLRGSNLAEGKEEKEEEEEEEEDEGVGTSAPEEEE